MLSHFLITIENKYLMTVKYDRILNYGLRYKIILAIQILILYAKN